MFVLHEAQSILVITIIWILVRLFFARIHKPDTKRELMLLLVYICIIVVFHFTMAGSTACLTDPELHRFTPKLNLKAFNFLTDRYDGWQRNIIGNFTMFIPVGFIWPLVFKKLNTYGKAVSACFLYTLSIEILQLLLLKPSLAILDETDSGLDVDAVRTVSKGIEAFQADKSASLLIITHNAAILSALKVDAVHILAGGKIVAEGQLQGCQRPDAGYHPADLP